MSYKQEKKQHDHLLRLLQKHFEDDEIEEAMKDMYGEEDDDEYMDDDMEDVVEDKDEMEEDFDPEDDMMEEKEEEEDEEEEMKLPKDKRKGLAVVILQKRMSKPKKDTY